MKSRANFSALPATAALRLPHRDRLGTSRGSSPEYSLRKLLRSHSRGRKRAAVRSARKEARSAHRAARTTDRPSIASAEGSSESGGAAARSSPPPRAPSRTPLASPPLVQSTPRLTPQDFLSSATDPISASPLLRQPAAKPRSF